MDFVTKFLILLVVIATSTTAFAQRIPRSLFEHDAEDVAVCQDKICTKLRLRILREAYRCRPLANFKQEKMVVPQYQTLNSCMLFHEKNFRTSKGECSAAVRAAAVSAFESDPPVLKGNAYDLQKSGKFEEGGFVNLIWEYNEESAPLGSILVYLGGRGHQYGHIEVRVNPHLYCSDYCSQKPISAVSAANGRRYKLAGVFVPFTSSIQTVNIVRR